VRQSGESPRKRSALLVDETICMDFGPDVLAASVQYNAPLYNLKDIFITHTHYDHLSVESIKRLTNDSTIFIATKDAKQTLETNFENKIIYVKPHEELFLGDLQVEVLPAYNLGKDFHKKKNGWVGYKVTKDETTYAILGDTDNIPELQTLSCDVLFVPIGGTYTMDPAEAAALANAITPKLVVPTHYGTVVGTKQNEKEFLSLLNKSIKHKILIKDAKK
jgi:L-ascorbate metabolism protein UlaG (beta-lactamase superfamily)